MVFVMMGFVPFVLDGGSRAHGTAVTFRIGERFGRITVTIDRCSDRSSICYRTAKTIESS